MPNLNWSPEVLHAETLYADADCSIALVTLNGANPPLVQTRCDMRYEVVAGSGVFYIADQAVIPVTNGSVVTIPAGTQYCDEGSMMLLATARPPFDQAQMRLIEG